MPSKRQHKILTNFETSKQDSREADVYETANDPGKVDTAPGDTTETGHNTGKDADALPGVIETTDAPENASGPTEDTASPTEVTVGLTEDTTGPTEDGEMRTVKTTEALIDSTAHVVSKNICIDLFIEFQKRLAMFAGELKGR